MFDFNGYKITIAPQFPVYKTFKRLEKVKRKHGHKVTQVCKKVLSHYQSTVKDGEILKDDVNRQLIMT